MPSEIASGRYARNQRSLDDGRMFALALMSIDERREPRGDASIPGVGR
jgi:hypothetical protein